MTLTEITTYLVDHADAGTQKMIRKNTQFSEVYGVQMKHLRALAASLGTQHELAQLLWQQTSYEHRMLAALLFNPQQLTQAEMEFCLQQALSSPIVDQALSDGVLQTEHPLEWLTHWCQSPNVHLRYGGWAILSAYFRLYPLEKMDLKVSHRLLDTIQATIVNEVPSIQNAMNNAVVMAGLHVPDLVIHATEVAEKIGYIMPTKALNSCNIQSALDYIQRYSSQPKFSRVARLAQKTK